MFPTIHSYEANDLNTQGYGALADAISVSVTEELNGSYTLEMKYPLDGVHSEYLVPSNIIMAKPSHNHGSQPFRINQVKRSFSNSIMVYANHISYDMSGFAIRTARNYNSLSDVITAINNMGWGTWASVYRGFTFRTDMSSNKSFSMPVAQTLRSWMGGQTGSILDTYGGEWDYDNFDVLLTSRRGSDTGIRISYGKNLSEYEKQRDNNLYSNVIAYWQKSDVYVYSDFVSTGANCFCRMLYVNASNDFEDKPTSAQLNTYAQSYISKMNMDTQTITVTPAQIGEVIGLGDSVLVCYDGVIQTRVIKTVWDVIAGVYTQLVLGSKTASISDTIKSLSPSEPKQIDYILEEGVTDGWTWTKWNSGKYECTYRGSATNVDCSTSWGNVYYGSIASVDFPIEFTDIPEVQHTVEVTSGGAWYSPAPSTKSKAGAVYMYRPTSSNSVSCTNNIHAVGRWKS